MTHHDMPNDKFRQTAPAFCFAAFLPAVIIGEFRNEGFGTKIAEILEEAIKESSTLFGSLTTATNSLLHGSLIAFYGFHSNSFRWGQGCGPCPFPFR